MTCRDQPSYPTAVHRRYSIDAKSFELIDPHRNYVSQRYVQIKISLVGINAECDYFVLSSGAGLDAIAIRTCAQPWSEVNKTRFYL